MSFFGISKRVGGGVRVGVYSRLDKRVRPTRPQVMADAQKFAAEIVRREKIARCCDRQLDMGLRRPIGISDSSLCKILNSFQVVSLDTPRRKIRLAECTTRN